MALNAYDVVMTNINFIKVKMVFVITIGAFAVFFIIDIFSFSEDFFAVFGGF